MNGITFGRPAVIGSIAIWMDVFRSIGKLGDDVRPGTWRAILKQPGIEEPER